MGRPPNNVPTVLVHTALPVTLKLMMDVYLRGLHGRPVRRGDYQQFFVALLEKFFGSGGKRIAKKRRESHAQEN